MKVPDRTANRSGGAPNRPIQALAVGLVLLGGGFLALLPLRPPDALPADAAPERFAAGRALAHVRALSGEPRPTGSGALDRARERLVAAAREVGAEVEVRESVVATDGGRRMGRMENVVARLPGTDPSGEVLLMAHYDTKAHSPGAADNAAGVAALLEAMRALAADGPLRNDVVFLFTDGEEIGLLGARAYLRERAPVETPGPVINLEARGTAGPSILFETGEGDGPLVDLYADVVDRPVAASYADDVYQRLPNDTDFTVFRERGFPGYNLAFIHGHTAYHTSLDQPERLDPRSLQHHGEQALALARHFAAADLADLPRGGRTVHFTLPAAGLVVYPASWSLAVAAVAVLAVLAVLGLLLSRGRLKGSDLAVGAAALLAAVIAAPLVVFLGQWLVALAFGLRTDNLGEGTLYLAGWATVAATAAAAVLLAFVRRRGGLAVAAGAAVLWIVPTAATALALPSSSYLFSWPLLAAAAALVLAGTETGTPLLRAVLLALLALPAVWLWLPAVALVGAALVPALGSTTAALLALLAALGVGTLALQLDAVAAGRPRILAGALLAVGLVLALVGAAGAGYGPERPRSASLLYFLDEDAPQARWVTFEDPADWNARFFAGETTVLGMGSLLDGRFGRSAALTAEAPVYDVPAPAVETVAVAQEDGARRLRLRLDSLRDAPEMRISLSSPGGLSGIRIDGVDLLPEDTVDEWTTDYFGLPAEGVLVEVTVDSDAPLEVGLVDRAQGFPPEASVAPRPEGLISGRFLPTDLTLVRNRTTLEPHGAEGEAPAPVPAAADAAATEPAATQEADTAGR